MFTIKYPNLFKPIRLGGTLFRNRIFSAPTGYQDLTMEGFLTPEAFAYYERKAMGGAASVCVGECVVDSKKGKIGLYHIVMDNPMASHSLNRLTDAVSLQGAVPVAELTHAGMYANRLLGDDGTSYGPSECEIGGRPVIEMTEDMIEDTIRTFANAAAWAKQCGFGMVNIHAAHGWLLPQFLSPQINKRRDKWGGSVENRCRIAIAIADAIRKKCGTGFPIEIRLSGSEGFEGGYGIDEGIAIAKQLDGHVDLLHISAGHHEVPEAFTVMCPSMFHSDGCNVKYAAEVKKHVKTPVAAVGALSDPDLMEEIIASGKADVVEIARGIIAEPDLPNKARAGQTDEIKKCLRCLNCFSSLLNRGQFYCAINPKAGHELEFKSDIPPLKRKKVLIAGGGIAGMQAAITCAERGHEAILCEKNDRLGGVLLCEEKIPFKKNLSNYIDFQVRKIRKAPIEVRLNTAITPEYAKAVAPDVIIAALGARAVIPDIKGINGKNVISAAEAYMHPENIGKRAAILGGGLVGAELALFLAQLGHQAIVIEMLDHLSDGGNFLHMMGLSSQLKKSNVDIRLSTKVKEITNKGVITISEEEEKIVTAETVIYAVGQRPLQMEAEALSICSPEYYQIGDCRIPGNIMNATATAYTAAKNIGRH